MSESDSINFNRFSLVELKNIARNAGINTNQSKANLVDALTKLFREDDKEKHLAKYKTVKQLGVKGKDGEVTMILSKNGKEYARKQFHHRKSEDKILKEIELQKKASLKGLSPKIIEFDTKNKYIVMEKLDKTLLEILQEQNGKLTDQQQSRIIQIFKDLDKLKIFHADPSVLNFMTNKEGEIFIIDFGFAKDIDDDLVKEHTSKPNMKYMPLGLMIKIKEMEPDVSFPIIEKYIKMKN